MKNSNLNNRTFKMTLMTMTLLSSTLFHSSNSFASTVAPTIIEQPKKSLRTVSQPKAENYSCRASCIMTAEDPNKDKPIYILHTDVMVEADSAEKGLAALRKECQGNDEKLVHSFEKGILKVEKKSTAESSTAKSKKNKSIFADESGEEYVVASSEANSLNSCVPTSVATKVDHLLDESGSVGSTSLQAE